MTAQINALLEGTLAETAQNLRGFNDKVIQTGKRVTGNAVDAYEKAAVGIADLQDEAASASKIRLVKFVAAAQAGVTRDFAKAYTSAARQLLH